MGNDDNTTFDAMAHLKILDVSCPQQLLSLRQWIMAGNQGLVYVRIMRAGSAVLYPSSFEFEFGKAYVLRESAEDRAVIVSSGRGVHEALAAAKKCAEVGVNVSVVDMPSVDEAMLLHLYDSGKLLGSEADRRDAEEGAGVGAGAAAGVDLASTRPGGTATQVAGNVGRPLRPCGRLPGVARKRDWSRRCMRRRVRASRGC